MAMMTWHLKKGSEKKFRSGHPWVFSNELAQSPKGILPGELIELRDFQGSVLARGYGHPNSLISFRTLTTGSRAEIDAGFFADRLRQAARVRRLAGVGHESHRLCFAEGDRLPGLVIDRFRLATSPAQVFVVQSSTAGMDRLLPQVFEALETLVRGEHQEDTDMPPWQATSIVLANDAKSRIMEGIAVEPKTVIRSADGFDPAHVRILIQAGLAGEPALFFEVDLIGGQKTGFFLDQRLNVQLVSRFAKTLANGRSELRVLDLCCYVGQWGAQLASVAATSGARARVTLVDASAAALEKAALNVEHAGGDPQILKVDVLDAFEKIESRAFDIVICDPPAFIKKKKDLPTGTQAYFKMNREAIRKTAPQGLFVSCSCSGLLSEEDFRGVLARASVASGADMRWLARGGHGPDHPQRPEFPQGTYLKSWIGTLC